MLITQVYSYQAFSRVQVTCRTVIIALAGHTGLNQRSIIALHIELRNVLSVVAWSTLLQHTHKKQDKHIITHLELISTY